MSWVAKRGTAEVSLKSIIYNYRRFRKRLGPRVAMYFVLTVLAAIVAHNLGPFIPKTIVDNLSRFDVQPILVALSGSMLTISTFSLSIVVSANFNAVSSTTPRAFRLLLEDQGTQDMLARFLGAFVFSSLTLMILPLGYYGGGGRVILLFVTVWFEISIIVSFVRWVMVVRELGSMAYSLKKIETHTAQSITEYFSDPFYGCRPFYRHEHPLEQFAPIFTNTGLYIQLIDESVLESVAQNYGVEIFINRLEGDFDSNQKPLLYVKGEVDEAFEKAVRKAFLFDDTRTLDDDPNFGILMLYQTASKALSPGINDPGTAISCIHSAYRLFNMWKDPETAQPRRARVWKRPVDFERMIMGFYEPIAHDAGDVIAVHVEILESLGALSRSHPDVVQKAAVNTAETVFERARILLLDPSDQNRLRACFDEMGFAKSRANRGE